MGRGLETSPGPRQETRTTAAAEPSTAPSASKEPPPQQSPQDREQNKWDAFLRFMQQQKQSQQRQRPQHQHENKNQYGFYGGHNNHQSIKTNTKMEVIGIF